MLCRSGRGVPWLGCTCVGEGCSALQRRGLLLLAGLGAVPPCLLTASNADRFPGNSTPGTWMSAWASSCAEWVCRNVLSSFIKQLDLMKGITVEEKNIVSELCR